MEGETRVRINRLECVVGLLLFLMAMQVALDFIFEYILNGLEARTDKLARLVIKAGEVVLNSRVHETELMVNGSVFNASF